MKGKHFRKTTKSTKRTKSIILSVVAILELVLLMTSFTFSWFEGLTSLEMKGSDIETASALKSHVVLGENKTATDETYSDIIDLTEFFDTQKDVRLSPVSSSDAKTFYAAYEGTPGSKDAKYRKLSTDDINANVIRFQFNISSDDGPTDVYLTEVLPIVYTNGTARLSNSRYANPYRFAFSDGTSTHILRTLSSLNGNLAYATPKQEAISYLNDDDTPVTVAGTVERAQVYAYYTDHRTTVTGLGTNATGSGTVPIQPLFHLEKGETKTITVSVWIEAFDTDANNATLKPAAGQDISFAVKLCTTWSIPRNITVYDYTATQWVNTKDTVTGTNDMVLCVRNADGGDTRRLYELTYDESTKSWSGSIPEALKNCELVWVSASDSSKKAHVTWQAPNRDQHTELTLFGSSTCVWGIGADDVTQIHFRDYTYNSWINNPDDKGNAIKMSVNITYNGQLLQYSMTDTPVLDANYKNSWSCWIPSSVDFVKFDRSGYNSDGKYVVFNYWNAADRGTETVYRANDYGDSGTDNSFTLYLKVESKLASKFFYSGQAPALSFTSDANKKVIEDVNGEYSQIYRKDYVPSTDEWPNGNSRFSRVTTGDDTLWYIVLDKKPAAGDYITIWNRTANGFNDIAESQSFGMIEYNGSDDIIVVNAMTELESAEAINNYYLVLEQDYSGSSSDGSTATENRGTWLADAKVDLSGSYTTYFVHLTDATGVSVTYNYGNDEIGVIPYTIPLEQNEDGVWYTNNIPDSVSTLNFTDSNGYMWSNITGRTSAKNHFYVTYLNGVNSTGRFVDISVLSGNTVYFKHYDTSATTLKATFTYDYVSFTVDLTKGSDNLTWSTSSIPSSVTAITFTDGTNTWVTSGRSTSGTAYCYALDKNTATWSTASNLVRIYFTDNWDWDSNQTLYIHYWGGSSSTTWPGIKLTYIGKNSGSETVYAALVPANSTGIIFNNGNGNGKQTSNITSNITDMMGFYISSGSGTSHTVKTWTVTASFLNTYSS